MKYELLIELITILLLIYISIIRLISNTVKLDTIYNFTNYIMIDFINECKYNIYNIRSLISIRVMFIVYHHISLIISFIIVVSNNV